MLISSDMYEIENKQNDTLLNIYFFFCSMRNMCAIIMPVLLNFPKTPNLVTDVMLIVAWGATRDNNVLPNKI